MTAKRTFLSTDAILLFTKPSSSIDKARDEIVSGILGQFKGNELEIVGKREMAQLSQKNVQKL